MSVSVGGTGVAGPVFLDHAAYREWVFRVWQARCVDMESTALAHVAWSNQVPILIVRGREILLARKKDWPQGRYSALAGFVEPGETIE
ncbi:MAG: hypothetical protein RLZZ221_734, partial [Verrucomicrobiota bacterium]